MDPDVCDVDVDQSEHLLVLDEDTEQSSLAGTLAMGGGIPAFFECRLDNDMDHAVSAGACGLGWQRELHESECTGRSCVGTGHHFCSVGFRLRDLTDLVLMARPSRFHDQSWLVVADVLGIHYWSFLPGTDSAER